MKTLKSIKKYLLSSLVIYYCSEYGMSPANSYLLMPDIDYYGGDMYSIYNVNSSLSCMNYCETIRDCRLATWCDNTCYIKNIKTNETQKIGCVTIDMYPNSTLIEDNSKSVDAGDTDSSYDNSSPTQPTNSPTQPTNSPTQPTEIAESSSSSLDLKLSIYSLLLSAAYMSMM